MSDAGGQLVGIEPPKIRFLSGRSEDETSSCLLQVSNQTDNYVAFKFKVKTMQVKWYNVKPRSGVLEPRSQREVVVTREVLKGADYSDMLCKDMFVLQCVRVNSDTIDADAEKMMEGDGHQVKKISVVFVSPDQPYRSVVKASEVAYPPGSSMSGTGNRSSFRPDDPPITTVFKEVTEITDKMAKLSPTASTTSVCGEGGGCDADDQETSLLMADANCQDEEEKEELVLPEGGGRDVDDDQDAILHVMNIVTHCQEEEEEPILHEGGGCDDQEHVNQELDHQNQSGLCPGHGTSDTEAQPNDATNREEHMQSASNGGQPDIERKRENQLPFTKTLSIWKTIESCEAFRLLPQRPHFRPLVELDPEIREQEAIKFTVGFATLVEKIATIQPDVSIDLGHYLKQLEDLGLFGFDVKAAVDRVSSLLAIQKKRGQIQRGLNDVRDRVTKKAEEKVKLEEGIKQMDRELKEAKRKQASRMSIKQREEAEAASLELELSKVNDKILSAEDQFKALVSSPW